MTTFGELTDECLSYLYSFGSSRDKLTSLVSSIGTTDLTFTVADGRQVDRGYIEIDSELMNVNSVDTSSGIVTLHPFGRGARTTTPAAHAQNVMVVCNPRFPRSRVQREINEVIDQLYPDLFSVVIDETQTVNAAVVTYALPAAALSVVSVQYQTVGPSKMWAPVTRYRYDESADLTAFPTGKSIDIFQFMQPGKTIKIRYRREMQRLVNESDDILTVGFIQEGWRDIIHMMTVGRLLMGLDPARLELDSIESAARSAGQGGVQPGAATAVGRQMIAMAQQRIATERRQLLTQYPTTQVRMN